MRTEEDSDTLIALLDRDANVNIWHVHEEGAKFAQNVEKSISSIIKRYEFNIETRCIIIKCREPVLTISNGPLQMPDYGPQLKLIAAEVLPYTSPDCVNFVVHKKAGVRTPDSKQQHTTKFREFISTNGDKFEISIIV